MLHRVLQIIALGLLISWLPVEAQVRDAGRAVHKGVMVLEGNSLQAVGAANYTIESQGRLLVQGSADAPSLGMKGMKFDRSFQVQPRNLQSARFQKVGTAVPFDGFLLKVIAVDRKRKLSTAVAKNETGSVVFVFDTSRAMIDLRRISLTSQALPVPLHLKRAG